MQNGAWDRKKYTGVQLYQKNLGVIGLGKIGREVAARAKAFGMEILAYDPYVSAQRAGQLGAQLVTLDELLEQSDFITVHLPKNAETLGLIGKEALTKVKPMNAPNTTRMVRLGLNRVTATSIRVMTVAKAGFQLVPDGFFDGNPALDLPRPSDNGHGHGS